MDISVLTEQRREMVINLLKGMKIRKSDGEGFDKDDVYACMQQLCDVYEKSIDDLTTGYEAQIGEMQDKYQKYDENNDLYISLIMEAKKSSNEIINKAKTEVDEILAAGKEQIALQQEEIEKYRIAVEQEKADLAADLEAAKIANEQEKADLAAAIEAEKQQAESVREQYRNQITVMDQEFDEIKTNILRTAGKIDGLKTQLEEAGETAQWTVEEEQSAIDVPEPDIAIEEVTEAEAPSEAPEELTFEQLVAKLQAEDFAKAEPAQIEVPEFEAPAVEIPAVEVPEVEVPAVEVPEVEIPAVEVPEVEVPEVEVPAVEVPEVEIPEEIDLTEEIEIAADVPEFPQEVPVEEVIPEVEAAAEPFFEGAEEAVGDIAEPVIEEIPVLEDVAPAVEEVAEETLADIDDLALEDVAAELPADLPVEEEPIDEISFEGLEELFKE